MSSIDYIASKCYNIKVFIHLWNENSKTLGDKLYLVNPHDTNESSVREVFSDENSQMNTKKRQEINAERMVILGDYARMYGVQRLANIILDSNPSSHLPYHGQWHMIATALIAVRLNDAARKQMLVCRLGNEWMRNVFIAALCHDANYDANIKNDDENIERAVEFFLNIDNDIRESVDSHIVTDLIRSTKYPHPPIDSHSPGYIYAAQLLRSADLLMNHEEDAAYFLKGMVLEDIPGVSRLFPFLKDGRCPDLEHPVALSEHRTYIECIKSQELKQNMRG